MTFKLNTKRILLTKDALSCSKSNISFSYCSASSFPKMIASSHIYWANKQRQLVYELIIEIQAEIKHSLFSQLNKTNDLSQAMVFNISLFENK